jgi:hypothetical protein
MRDDNTNGGAIFWTAVGVKNNRKDAVFLFLGASQLAVQSRSVVESAMPMLHSGRPYGTDSSRQRQDRSRRPICYTAIEGFDPRARQPLRPRADSTS